MKFRSDNATGTPPEIIEALANSNHGARYGYGKDDDCARAESMMRELLEAKDARVYFVVTGTAANALALGSLVNPWETIYCHKNAHIEVDEAGAPEFYTNGAKLKHVKAERGVIDPNALHEAIRETGAIGVHNWQRGAVSVTNITEQGALYSAEKLQEIGAVAREFSLPLHLDGARFANSVVAANESPAHMSHKAGVDALVFGGTKNGLMMGEAVVLFGEERAWEFEMRRKRGGHLLSKGQFLGAQFIAMLENENWRKWAQNANDKMQMLYASLSAQADVHFDNAPEGNMAYLRFPRAIHQRLFEAGAEYYIEPATQSLEGPADELIRARLVTSWATRDEEIAEFVKYFDS